MRSEAQILMKERKAVYIVIYSLESTSLKTGVNGRSQVMEKINRETLYSIQIICIRILNLEVDDFNFNLVCTDSASRRHLKLLL